MSGQLIGAGVLACTISTAGSWSLPLGRDVRLQVEGLRGSLPIVTSAKAHPTLSHRYTGLHSSQSVSLLQETAPPMSAYSLQISNLSQLRDFIHQTLCEHEYLEPGVFPMTERILTRGGNACGILFSLHGPRSVRLNAIWENENNTVLFYGSTGERFGKMQLIGVPNLAPATA